LGPYLTLRNDPDWGARHRSNWFPATAMRIWSRVEESWSRLRKTTYLRREPNPFFSHADRKPGGPPDHEVVSIRDQQERVPRGNSRQQPTGPTKPQVEPVPMFLVPSRGHGEKSWSFFDSPIPPLPLPVPIHFLVRRRRMQPDLVTWEGDLMLVRWEMSKQAPLPDRCGPRPGSWPQTGRSNP
jgi:hypothetical protein